MENTAADILERIIQPDQGDLAPGVAELLLGWRFKDSDRQRMSELSNLASDGSLSDAQRRELDEYLRMGHLLAIAHSKARRALLHKPAA